MKNLLLTTLLFLSFAQAETFQCKVVGVTDGDTITCLTDQKEQVKVRLYQIDAPELNQPYGEKAQQLLSDMVLKKNVLIVTELPAKDKMTFGIVYLLERGDFCLLNLRKCNSLFYDVNYFVILSGFAWHYPLKANMAEHNDVNYILAEIMAKAAERGLWADKHAMPPWEWRKEKRK